MGKSRGVSKAFRAWSSRHSWIRAGTGQHEAGGNEPRTEKKIHGRKKSSPKPIKKLASDPLSSGEGDLEKVKSTWRGGRRRDS